MKHLFLLLTTLITSVVGAQTVVNNASFSYAGGVYPTFSVLFTGTDAGTVEKWFKDQLKPISADMGGRKEIMSIGTRLPGVSSDTMRVFVKADQPRKSKDVTLHAAFRLNGVFIGPDSDERQREGCRDWMYQNAVMLKKELAQAELTRAQKDLAHLESDLALLIKEKERAENTMEKTRRNIADDEKDKDQAAEDSKRKATEIEAKKEEVATSHTEDNAKELGSLIKEQQKLDRQVEKLARNIANGKKKIDDLEFDIKKNIQDQDAKTEAIDAQKKRVEELTSKLAGIN